jgi:hypothetical protein
MNEYYQITRGIMEFSNANPTEPVLNIVLTTTINQYNLSLIFPGPLDKMQTSYLVRPAADSRQFNRPGTDHAGSGLSLQPWGEFPAGARGRQPGKQRRPKTGQVSPACPSIPCWGDSTLAAALPSKSGLQTASCSASPPT